MTPRPHGSAPHGAVEGLGPSLGPPIAASPLSPGDRIFFAVEVEVYQPGVASLTYDLGRGSRPRGTVSRLPQVLETTGLIRASDLGYRGQDTDTGGMRVFPPVLEQAFEIDRAVALDPTGGANRAFGAIRLDNLGQRFDAFAQTRNSDNRPVRMMVGRKGWDGRIGIETDPPFAALLPFFCGVALPWQLGEVELTIPIADPAAWLDRPVQSSLYLGTGGLEGGAALAGKPRPMTRGGSPSTPVRDVPLIQVDPVNLVYQWTDAPGTVVALYEGGAGVFAYDGDVANIYGGTPPAAGHYRTCNALGVLQLGSKPVRQLSADATGAFPLSGVQNTPGALARAMLTDDMGLALSLLDLVSFDDAVAGYPYPAGYHVGTDPMQGLTLLQLILGSINARLASTRGGKLRCLVLGPTPVGSVPIATLTEANLEAVAPQPLPTLLDPPPGRWRVAYAKTWLVQTSDLAGSISATRQQELATESRYGTWDGAAVRTAWRRPNDPDPLDTVLLTKAAADEVAGRLGAMFAARPGLYAVQMPIAVATGIDLGSVVLLRWPIADLGNGRIGQVVGEQVRSVDANATLMVLVA